MKIQYITSFALAAAVLVSCQSEKKKPSIKSEYLRPAEMTYTKEDTATIYSLVDEYVQAFRSQDFEHAAGMLHVVKSDSVVPLTAKEQQEFVQRMGSLPIYACKIQSFLLRSDKNNEVKLAIQLIPSGDMDKGIGVTHLSLNPVVKDGQWYLTLLDEEAEGVRNVYQE